MKTTKLSGEGQIVIPQELRDAHGWEIGQELMVINMGECILIKPKKPFPATTLNDVAGCLKYQGNSQTLEDMENAIPKGRCITLTVFTLSYQGKRLPSHDKNSPLSLS